MENITRNSTSEEDSLYALKYLIPVTILYVLIFITGLLGNLSICLVIVRNKFMHTTTNFYLFNMAVADMTILIFGLLPELFRHWTMNKIVPSPNLCVLQRLLLEISAHATVLTVTAFTVDRYIAICHPFLSITLDKLSRVKKFIVVIWILALCMSVPQIFRMCFLCTIQTDFIKNVDNILKHSSEIRSLLIFAIPMSLITVLYVIIAVKLRNSHKLQSSKNSADQKKVIKMLVAVVISFFLCWAPFHIHRIFAMYYRNASKEEQDRLNDAYDIIFHVSGVFWYMSATVNPFLYSIMSKKFRQAFKATFGYLSVLRERFTSYNTTSRQNHTTSSVIVSGESNSGTTLTDNGTNNSSSIKMITF